jgi:hypothetical protein
MHLLLLLVLVTLNGNKEEKEVGDKFQKTKLWRKVRRRKQQKEQLNYLGKRRINSKLDILNLLPYEWCFIKS